MLGALLYNRSGQQSIYLCTYSLHLLIRIFFHVCLFMQFLYLLASFLLPNVGSRWRGILCSFCGDVKSSTSRMLCRIPLDPQKDKTETESGFAAASNTIKQPAVSAQQEPGVLGPSLRFHTIDLAQAPEHCLGLTTSHAQQRQSCGMRDNGLMCTAGLRVAHSASQSRTCQRPPPTEPRLSCCGGFQVHEM